MYEPITVGALLKTAYQKYFRFHICDDTETDGNPLAAILDLKFDFQIHLLSSLWYKVLTCRTCLLNCDINFIYCLTINDSY